ncbi:MAG TPA: chemotaxis protein CheW [Geobacteraceae bacterium]
MSNVSARLLLFTVREDRYALDLQDVAEVLTPPVIFPVPWAPPCVTGAMNFHGSLVTVLDLAGFLGCGTMAPEGNLLVLDRGIANLALWIDRVENIAPADGVLEEDTSNDPLVEKVLIMADGEVRKLAVARLLEKVEAAMRRETKGS